MRILLCSVKIIDILSKYYRNQTLALVTMDYSCVAINIAHNFWNVNDSKIKQYNKSNLSNIHCTFTNTHAALPTACQYFSPLSGTKDFF